MRFTAELERVESGTMRWLVVPIPFSVKAALGRGGIVNVRGAINGFPFQTAIFPKGGGRHFMMVNKKMMAGARVAEAGDAVEIEIEPDVQPKPLTLSPAFKAALARRPRERKYFESLSLTFQRAFARRVAEAKPAARGRRAEEEMARLAALAAAEAHGLPEIEALLSKLPAVRATFRTLGKSYRRLIFFWILDGKAAATRQRRAAKFVAKLRAGEKMWQ